ncbi:hypothetical protein BDW02DRAFT_399852 [Decorospora gaudefroyi]|uniref:Uncharacterized protein n=1 Tax=Decorospora gaudefroyi TaxID=184978 RepID=A0A6A5KCH5_9PLEO|nr:hypothetical protein BDW02DRAFT_399852 [Decorospora gaudefroyi]
MSNAYLTMSLKSADLVALSQALYGSEHGFGERILALQMTSRSPRYRIEFPICCRYKDNIPSFTADRVVRETWDALCGFASEEPFLRVKLAHDGSSYYARVSVPGNMPVQEGRVEVRLSWREYDEVRMVLRRGVEWVKKKLV